MKKAKKFASFLLTIVLLFSAMVFPATAAGGLENFVPINTYEGQFSDVPTNSWFYDNVSAVYNLGLMQGESDTYFNANGNLSIAEAIAMAARLHSIYRTGEEHFVQDETCWYQVYVDYARKNGIIDEDYENITKAATRAEYVSLLASALPDAAYEEINTVDKGTIPDVLLSAPYAEDVYKLYKAGILTGSDEQGSFEPDGYIKRNAASAILARIAVPALRQEVTLPSIFSYSGSSRMTIRELIELSFSFKGDGTLQYSLESGDVFRAFWSKSWSGDTLTLYIVPNARGTDTVTVTNSENQEKISVTITVAAPEDLCYAEFSGIPDFAKVTGVNPVKPDANNVYLYSHSIIGGLTAEDYTRYESFLEGYGFQYVQSYQNDFQETLYVYKNAESGIVLHIGWTDYYGAGGFVVSIIEP